MANLTDLMVNFFSSISSETKVFASSGNKVNAIASASIPAVSGKTSVLDGVEITASGATGALVVTATITDGTWTLNYTFTFPAGVTVAAQPLVLNFPKPLVASAPNTAITVSLPASGAGGTNAAVNVRGRQV